MRKVSPLATALLCTLAAAAGSMRLWWLHAPRLAQRYIVDYCRFAVAMPSFRFWPYRIETVQHLPITDVPGAVFGGRPLYQVLLWPLVATVLALIGSVLIAAKVSAAGPGKERLLSGPRILSHRAWNWPLLFRKEERGYYIETE